MHFLTQQALSKTLLSCTVQNKRSGRILQIIAEPSKLIGYVHNNYLIKGWRTVGNTTVLTNN